MKSPNDSKVAAAGGSATSSNNSNENNDCNNKDHDTREPNKTPNAPEAKHNEARKPSIVSSSSASVSFGENYFHDAPDQTNIYDNSEYDGDNENKDIAKQSTLSTVNITISHCALHAQDSASTDASIDSSSFGDQAFAGLSTALGSSDFQNDTPHYDIDSIVYKISCLSVYNTNSCSQNTLASTASISEVAASADTSDNQQGKQTRSASLYYLKVPPVHELVLGSLANDTFAEKTTRSQSVDISLPSLPGGGYNVMLRSGSVGVTSSSTEDDIDDAEDEDVENLNRVQNFTTKLDFHSKTGSRKKFLQGEIKIACADGQTRALKLFVDWKENCTNGEHLWIYVGSSSEACYVGEHECSKQGPRLSCSICKISAHTGCIAILSNKIKFFCRLTFKDLTVGNPRQLKEISQQTITFHHWVHKRSHGGRCKHCSKTFANAKLPFTSKDIQAITCSWCKVSYHNIESCYNLQALTEPCTFGSHRESIIPPTWIVKLPKSLASLSDITNFDYNNDWNQQHQQLLHKATVSPMETSDEVLDQHHHQQQQQHSQQQQDQQQDQQQVYKLTPIIKIQNKDVPSLYNSTDDAQNVLGNRNNVMLNVERRLISGPPLTSFSCFKIIPHQVPGVPSAGTKPVLVLINPRSGGNQGSKMMQKFNWSLNPRQVFDLIQCGGPRPAIELFKHLKNLRILTVGGDGTAAWILQCLDEAGVSNRIPVAVLPLGTGNDLARALGWSGAHADELTAKILAQVREGEIVKLDRWNLRVERNPDVPCPLSTSSFTSTNITATTSIDLSPITSSTTCSSFSNSNDTNSLLTSQATTSSIGPLRSPLHSSSINSCSLQTMNSSDNIINYGSTSGCDTNCLLSSHDQHHNQAEQPPTTPTTTTSPNGPNSSSGTDKLPMNVINNYFSFGVDAHIALEFHTAREAHPEKFNSRLRNKMFYGQAGGKDLLKRKWKDLSNYVTLYCDGFDMTARLKELKVHSVLFLNIPSYGGGTRPWPSTNTAFQKPRTDDGLIEVIGLTTYQLPLLQAGGHGTCIAQCRSAKIVTTRSIPMQVDGEPCNLLPSVIYISFRNKVCMLAKSKGANKQPVNLAQKQQETQTLTPTQTQPQTQYQLQQSTAIKNNNNNNNNNNTINSNNNNNTTSKAS